MSEPAANSPIERGAKKSQPLYVQIAGLIGERIETDAYPIGALLPTEAQFCESFGVSRHTVRQAIQHLRLQGLVTARKGIGTRVDAKRPNPAYFHPVHAMSEALQFAHSTKLVLHIVREQAATGRTAAALGCRSGKQWLYLKGLRFADGKDRPLCLTEAYIDTAFKSVAEEACGSHIAICALIEKRFGETIVEVDQETEAVILSQDNAEQLQAEAGSPAMRVTRRFYAFGRRLLEMAVSIHPADRYTYSVTLKRDFANGTAG